jgi:hypothetical protein
MCLRFGASKPPDHAVLTVFALFTVLAALAGKTVPTVITPLSLRRVLLGGKIRVERN